MTKKLVLFDIDETIIDSDGAGRRAIGRALLDLFGVKPEGVKVNMSGKTDPEILSEIMLASGYSEEAYKERLEEFLDLYVSVLAQELKNSATYRVHEGVYELLRVLDRKANVFLGLLTGNIERGARLKLDKFGLNHYFPVGAFGSDSPDRLNLPAIAQQRAEKYYKAQFEPAQIVIIGDSVRDVLCAQSYGAVCIAVNTGRTTRQELEALSPNFLFPSLKNVPEVLQAIMHPAVSACSSG